MRLCHSSALLIRSHSANFVTIRDGKPTLAYGTSASVQVVGAIMALINDARLANDKSTIGESYLLLGGGRLIFMAVGFINPLVRLMLITPSIAS